MLCIVTDNPFNYKIFQILNSLNIKVIEKKERIKNRVQPDDHERAESKAR